MTVTEQQITDARELIARSSASVDELRAWWQELTATRHELDDVILALAQRIAVEQQLATEDDDEEDTAA